jgi:hypothetical protein
VKSTENAKNAKALIEKSDFSTLNAAHTEGIYALDWDAPSRYPG